LLLFPVIAIIALIVAVLIMFSFLSVVPDEDLMDQLGHIKYNHYNGVQRVYCNPFYGSHRLDLVGGFVVSSDTV
jgi:hypothetical protein